MRPSIELNKKSRRYLLPIVSGATKACDEVGKKYTDLAEIDDHERQPDHDVDDANNTPH